jgi:hypothetical protein
MKQGWLILALSSVCFSATACDMSNLSLTESSNSEAPLVQLQSSERRLTLKENGQLFFDVHRIGLSEDQQRLMAKYHQTVLMQQSLESDIQRAIPALSSWQTVAVPEIKSLPRLKSLFQPN